MLPFATASSTLKGLIIVPVGTMGPFLLGDNPVKTENGIAEKKNVICDD